MRTYRFPGGGLARALRHLGVLVLTLSWSIAAHAQERRYLFEVGASGLYQSYAKETGLDGAVGGLARIGVWLPLNFSLEAEGSIASPNKIGVKTFSGSALYNVLLGSRTWGYVKAGVGGTKYGTTGPP